MPFIGQSLEILFPTTVCIIAAPDCDVGVVLGIGTSPEMQEEFLSKTCDAPQSNK